MYSDKLNLTCDYLHYLMELFRNRLNTVKNNPASDINDVLIKYLTESIMQLQDLIVFQHELGSKINYFSPNKPESK